MEQNNLFVPEWNNPTSDERNELVFEKKNKSYGAFILRKNYTKNILVAFIITAIAVTAFAMIPLTQALLKPKAKKFKITAAVISNVEEIPEEKEEEKVEEIEQPKIATQKATEFAPTETETVEAVNPFDEMVAAGLKQQGGITDPNPEDEFLEGNSDTKKIPKKRFTGFELEPRYLGKNSIEEDILNLIDQSTITKYGPMLVAFTVNKKGKVEEATIKVGLNPEVNAEILRVLKTLKFKPALQNGNAVQFPMQVPFTIELGE